MTYRNSSIRFPLRFFCVENYNISKLFRGHSRKGRKMKYYNMKESGKRLKDLRKKKGYTQESFAHEIGISHRTYSGIESGAHSTSIDTFVEIAQGLETSLDYLILGKENSELEIDIPEEKKELALKILKGILENI